MQDHKKAKRHLERAQELIGFGSKLAFGQLPGRNANETHQFGSLRDKFCEKHQAVIQQLYEKLEEVMNQVKDTEYRIKNTTDIKTCLETKLNLLHEVEDLKRQVGGLDRAIERHKMRASNRFGFINFCKKYENEILTLKDQINTMEQTLKGLNTDLTKTNEEIGFDHQIDKDKVEKYLKNCKKELEEKQHEKTDLEQQLESKGTELMPLNYTYMINEVIPAVKKNGMSLVIYSDEIRDQPNVVLSAVQQNGMALQFASEELKNNKVIVTNAVRQNGMALKFASERLKDDADVVFEALQNGTRNIKFASERLKKCPPPVYEAPF